MSFVLKQRVADISTWVSGLPNHQGKVFRRLYLREAKGTPILETLMKVRGELECLCKALAYLGDDGPLKEINIAQNGKIGFKGCMW